ncbi:MAG: galactokinase [Clostridia bacterium]|nr:galactokinase [Clostridia bacterium]
MDLKLIYGENADLKFYENRIAEMEKVFLEKEGYPSKYVFSSSGRAEILGNHTDHNHGFVMVASISCDIVAAVSERDDTIVKVCSLGYPDVVVDISDLSIKEEEFSTSNALVRGVAKALTDRGFKFKGFTAYTTSNIFKGAGVSSSAAFEVLVTEIFNYIYLSGAISLVERANISQYAENVYFNKPCGLLDQNGISTGSLIKLDFNVPTSPIITQMTPPKGYSLVITNTGGDHASLTEHYAAIRREMEEVAAHFGKKVLKDVPYDVFLKEVSVLKEKFSSRAILRSLHFYNENERVLNAEKALVSGDTKAFLKEVNESGISSIALLQNCYVPGETNQPVVLGIELSRAIIKDGAVRVHGGGFAGSILAFVNDNEVDAYVEKMQEVFGNENVFKANIRKIGTTIIKENK